MRASGGLLVLLAGIFVACGAGNDAETQRLRAEVATLRARIEASPVASPPSPSPTPATERRRLRVSEPSGFGDGTYVVGESVQPGRYRATDLQRCHWVRFSGSSADSGVGDLPRGASAVVDILPTDQRFTTIGCGRWTDVLPPVTSSITLDFGDGTYIVGLDIAPGRWRASDTGRNCIWARLAGFTHEVSEFLMWGFGEIADIAASDVGFWTEGCGTWERVD